MDSMDRFLIIAVSVIFGVILLLGGIGLAISRELTNLLRGQLSLRSAPGSGAVFTVTLPVRPPDNGAEPPADA